MIRSRKIGRYDLYAEDGAEMPESERDVTGNTILDRGLDFEPHVWKEIERIKPKRFLDIGCNVGLYTIGVKDLVPDAEVLAVDVSKQNCQLLMQTLIKNKIDGVTVLNVALADCPRIIQIQKNPVNTVCNSSFNAEDDGDWEYAFALPLSAFDIKQPFDLIKIDVDGFEYLIMRGITGRLLQCPIIFEFCPQLSHRSDGASPEQLLDWFFGHGFKLTCLDYQAGFRKECRDAQEVMEHLKKTSGWITDILAEPDESEGIP